MYGRCTIKTCKFRVLTSPYGHLVLCIWSWDAWSILRPKRRVKNILMNWSIYGMSSLLWKFQIVKKIYKGLVLCEGKGGSEKAKKDNYLNLGNHFLAPYFCLFVKRGVHLWSGGGGEGSCLGINGLNPTDSILILGDFTFINTQCISTVGVL